MSFKRTTAINKILAMTARKKVIQGGTSSGKTYGIIPVLIDRAAKRPNLKITVVAETIPAVRDGASDIFKAIMRETGRWRDSGWIGNPMEYTFSNGSRIQFKAFDTFGKAKAAGKRDILFINEANHVSYNIADALIVRSKEVFLDFNPDNEFWAHTEILTEPNSEFLTLTYLENEGVPKETVEELLIKKSKAFFDVGLGNERLFLPSNIKNAYWSNWWKVYGLGLTGTLEGVVFTNWSKVDNIPEEAKLLGGGIDFGFTNDPTTVINAYEYNKQRIYEELVYEKGLLNNELAKKIIASGNKNTTYYADCADPKSIKELNTYGLKIRPSLKGADSIRNGINLMQANNFLVTSSSTNSINELRRYAWDMDKEGNKLNKPIDSYNHSIDAMRYFEQTHKSDKPRARIKW